MTEHREDGSVVTEHERSGNIVIPWEYDPKHCVCTECVLAQSMDLVAKGVIEIVPGTEGDAQGPSFRLIKRTP